MITEAERYTAVDLLLDQPLTLQCFHGEGDGRMYKVKPHAVSMYGLVLVWFRKGRKRRRKYCHTYQVAQRYVRGTYDGLCLVHVP